MVCTQFDASLTPFDDDKAFAADVKVNVMRRLSAFINSLQIALKERGRWTLFYSIMMIMMVTMMIMIMEMMIMMMTTMILMMFINSCEIAL